MKRGELSKTIAQRGSFRRHRSVATVLAALCVGAIATDAMAQDSAVQLAQTDTQKTFNIPAQPLASALIAFGEQAGVQFSVDSDLTPGKRTNGVSGSYSAEDALRQLLAARA